MNLLDCINYYITNKNEFFAEEGHNVLLESLKRHVKKY
jgi:hypothetical protein